MRDWLGVFFLMFLGWAGVCWGIEPYQPEVRLHESDNPAAVSQYQTSQFSLFSRTETLGYALWGGEWVLATSVGNAQLSYQTLSVNDILQTQYHDDARPTVLGTLQDGYSEWVGTLGFSVGPFLSFGTSGTLYTHTLSGKTADAFTVDAGVRGFLNPFLGGVWIKNVIQNPVSWPSGERERFAQEGAVELGVRLKPFLFIGSFSTLHYRAEGQWDLSAMLGVCGGFQGWGSGEQQGFAGLRVHLPRFTANYRYETSLGNGLPVGQHTFGVTWDLAKAVSQPF